MSTTSDTASPAISQAASVGDGGKHSPTPWRLELGRVLADSPVFGFGIFSDYRHPLLPRDMKMHSIASANLYEHCAYTGCFTPEEIEANATFIVKAVNAHEGLVEHLRRLAVRCCDEPALEFLDATENKRG